MPSDPPPPADELDPICRQMLAQTMRPCRELTRAERAQQAAEAAALHQALDEHHDTRIPQLRAV